MAVVFDPRLGEVPISHPQVAAALPARRKTAGFFLPEKWLGSQDDLPLRNKPAQAAFLPRRRQSVQLPTAFVGGQ